MLLAGCGSVELAPCVLDDPFELEGGVVAVADDLAAFAAMVATIRTAATDASAIHIARFGEGGTGLGCGEGIGTGVGEGA